MVSWSAPAIVLGPTGNLQDNFSVLDLLVLNGMAVVHALHYKIIAEADDNDIGIKAVVDIIPPALPDAHTVMINNDTTAVADDIFHTDHIWDNPEDMTKMMTMALMMTIWVSCMVLWEFTILPVQIKDGQCTTTTMTY